MKKYDVVIVGAGIGGLVCGCYLAKNGLKVLIVEQHHTVGGYCSSFLRSGYRFDIGVHYLGSLKNGIIRKVLDELGICMPVSQSDQTDIIIMPDSQTIFHANIEDTINSFKKNFPEQKNSIDNFFDFVYKTDFRIFYEKTRKQTFRQLLDYFFDDYRIKAVLTAPLGNIGVTACNSAATPVGLLYREYLLDSGYYPQGGMQSFPDILLKSFRGDGGDIILNESVERIIQDNIDKKFRLVLRKGEEYLADKVVSDIDVSELFKKIVDCDSRESKVVDLLMPSSSLFIVYLGIDIGIEKVTKFKSNVWHFSDYNVDKTYEYLGNNIIEKSPEFFNILFPSMHDCTVREESKSTVILMIPAPYISGDIWKEKKEKVTDILLGKALDVMPDLEKHIKLKFSATPATLYRYTKNMNGAFVGWQATLGQIKSSLLPQRTSIKGLYLVGHWCTMGSYSQGGIPGVVASGRKGAELVVKDYGFNWMF